MKLVRFSKISQPNVIHLGVLLKDGVAKIDLSSINGTHYSGDMAGLIKLSKNLCDFKSDSPYR